jgi:hypothetical protein
MSSSPWLLLDLNHKSQDAIQNLIQKIQLAKDINRKISEQIEAQITAPIDTSGLCVRNKYPYFQSNATRKIKPVDSKVTQFNRFSKCDLFFKNHAWSTTELRLLNEAVHRNLSKLT